MAGMLQLQANSCSNVCGGYRREIREDEKKEDGKEKEEWERRGRTRKKGRRKIIMIILGNEARRRQTDRPLPAHVSPEGVQERRSGEETGQQRNPGQGQKIKLREYAKDTEIKRKEKVL